MAKTTKKRTPKRPAKLDKRTKEYKEWKEKFEEVQEERAAGVGLGDIIEKVTEATGIKAIVKSIFDDCGCDERKEKLNNTRIFKHKKLECLTDEEHAFLTLMFDDKKQIFSNEEQFKMKNIYQRVFNVRVYNSCTSCSFMTKIYKPLKAYYDIF